MKAPSRVDIQQQLIEEEHGEHSIHGQTSWILCGLKIQEMQYVHMKHISVLHQANECLDLHSDISSGAEVHSLPPRSPKSSKTSAFACRSSLTCLSIRQMGFSSTINPYMMFRYQHLMTMWSMIMQMTPMTPEFQDPTYRSLMHLRVRASMQNTFPSSSHRHLDRTGVSGMVSRHLQSKSLSSATLRQ